MSYRATNLVKYISKFCGVFPRGKGAIARFSGRLFSKLLEKKYITTRYGAKLIINHRNIDFFSTMARWDNSWEHWVFDTARWFLSDRDVFYDVGSNVGYMSIEMLQVKPKIKTFAFEPQPDLARLLQESIRLNDFSGRGIVINAGVSNNVKHNATLIIPEHTGHASIENQNKPIKGEKISINLVVLDDLVSQKIIDPPDLIKIDIEGHEKEALSGAAEIIKKFGPHIVFESSSTLEYRDVSSYIRSLGNYRFFYAIGSYRLVKEIEVEGVNNQTEKFDVIAVNMDRENLPDKFLMQIT